MSNFKILGISFFLLGTIALINSSLKYLKSTQPNAGIKVLATPASEVFINNTSYGLSPVSKVFPPGEVTVRVGTYTSTVQLNPGVYTVVRRDLKHQAAGELLTLRPNQTLASTFSLASSVPNLVSVTMDGHYLGLTPLTKIPISVGPHTFIVSSLGFKTLQFQAQAYPGYDLEVNIKLSQLSSEPNTTPLPQ
jgi:hypothetical protein